MAGKARLRAFFMSGRAKNGSSAHFFPLEMPWASPKWLAIDCFSGSRRFFEK
jgi:hypothetical protein